MPHSLAFDRVYPYTSAPLTPQRKPRIPVRVYSVQGARHLDLRMLVDSGADVTSLPTPLMAPLGIVSSGLPLMATRGVGGASTSYLYEQLHLSIGGWGFFCPVLFVDGLRELILGRAHVFDLFCFAFEQSESKLHVRLPARTS